MSDPEYLRPDEVVHYPGIPAPKNVPNVPDIKEARKWGAILRAAALELENGRTEMGTNTERVAVMLNPNPGDAPGTVRLHIVWAGESNSSYVFDTDLGVAPDGV